MWWARSEVVDVYLSGSRLVLRAGGGPAESIAIEAGDWRAAVSAVVADWPGRRWRLGLGGRLCTLHSVEPIAGIKHIEEAETALSALLGSAEVPAHVRLAVWSPRGTAPWMAACLPAELPGTCLELIEASKGKLVSLRPWWAAARAPEPRAAAMCDDEAITYWRTDAQGNVTAGSLLVAQQGEGNALRATLQRLRVNCPLPAWQLAWDAAPPQNGGFAAQALQEVAHGPPSAAV